MSSFQPKHSPPYILYNTINTHYFHHKASKTTIPSNMVPPPPPPPPPPQNQVPPTHSKLVKAIAILLLALIVLVGVAVLTIWLTVKPRRLVYSIEDGSIHGFNLTNNRLNASFNFVLRAYNPNSKVSIYYDKVEVLVSYEDQTVAFNNVGAFFQPHRNVTRLGVNLVAHDVLMFGPVGRDLGLEKSSGEVEVEVKVKARVRFKVGVWRSKRRNLRVSCAPVVIYFSSSKGFERTLCDVHL